MKKLLSLLLTAILATCCAVAFTACNKQSPVGTYNFYSVNIDDDIYNLGDEFNENLLTEDFFTCKISKNNTFEMATKNNPDKIQKGKVKEWHGHYLLESDDGTVVAEREGCYLYIFVDEVIVTLKDSSKKDLGEVDHSKEDAKLTGNYELSAIKETVKETQAVTNYKLGDNFHDVTTLTSDSCSLEINSDKTFTFTRNFGEEGIKNTFEGSWNTYGKNYVLIAQSWFSSNIIICSFDGDNLVLQEIGNGSPNPYTHELTLTKKA